MLTGNYDREPGDPQGNGPQAIWLRALKRWIRRSIIMGVKGGRLVRDAGGGQHLIIDTPFGSATPGGGGISFFAVNGVSGADYVAAQQIVATQVIAGVGTIVFELADKMVNIAKWFAHRPSNYLNYPETFDGVTVSYTAPPPVGGADAAYNDNNRVATINTNGENQIENQVLFPRYTTIAMTGTQPSQVGVNWYAVNGLHQAILAAADMSGQNTAGGGTGNLTGVFVGGNELQWLEVPQRVWAKRYIQ